jgi:hypothetical protein
MGNNKEETHKPMRRQNWAEQNAVEPGYNDIGLYDTTFTASDFLW